MSARRQARAHAAVEIVDENRPPAHFLIGRCREVWSNGEPFWQYYARRRFNDARQRWLDEHGVSDRDTWKVIPEGSAWSIADLTATGRPEVAEQRLARAGVTIVDIPRLKREADAA